MQHPRVLWAFWLACGLAAVAGIAPLLLAGPSSRIGSAIIPFGVAAIALAGCALLHQQGRPIATTLYFIAGLAIVYAILALIAVPLRLAVIGTCPPAPAACAVGFERPLTPGESTGFAFAIGMGIVAVLTGFFGLITLYRRSATPRSEPSTPMMRRIAPVAQPTPATPEKPAEPGAAVEPVEPAGGAPPRTADPAAAPEPQLELEAPEQELELPAHVEPLELAAPTEPATETETVVAASKPKRRRSPKKVSDPEPPPGTP